MMKRIAPVVALMLVLTVAVPTGLVGTVAATHDCDNLDAAVAFATFTYVNHDKCTNNHVSHAVEDVAEADANQTKRSIYDAGLQQKADDETFISTFDNYLNDTEAAAWMAAEKAIAQAYANGSSETEAKSAARDAIDRYYVTKQINLIEQYNTTLFAMEKLSERAESEYGISDGYVYSHVDHEDGSSYDKTDAIDMSNHTDSVTLVDGSTHDIQAVYHEGYWDKNISFVDRFKSSRGYSDYLAVKPYDSGSSHLKVLRFGDYKSRFNRIDTLHDNLINESYTYTEGVYQALDSGQINASDVTSRTTKMFEYGTESVNGSGNMYDSVAALSSLGVSSPELNGTGTMNVSVNGTTYHGLLLADNAPNGSWNIGSTYNASDISGNVMLATTGGSLKTLDGQFTLVSATDQSGDLMNETASIGTKKVVYKTADTSEFIDKMAKIQQEIEEIEERKTGTGGGSGDGSSNLSDLEMTVGVVALVAVVLFARGGRRD